MGFFFHDRHGGGDIVQALDHGPCRRNGFQDLADFHFLKDDPVLAHDGR